MWVPKKKWVEIQKEIDSLKKEHLSLNEKITESIESNKQLISIVKDLQKFLETLVDS